MQLFNKKIGVRFLFYTLAALILTSLPICFGQATAATAGMTGVVTDQSGAVIPGVSVTLSNKATGAKFTETTNSTGVYRFLNIPPGEGYEAVFSGTGFDKVDIKGLYLTAETVRTQNATLTVGAQQQVVEVNASNSVVTLDTTDATIGNNIGIQELNNLPVQQRNDPLALFSMQPGVTDTGSVTGARVDQNDVTVDGLDVNDFATGNAMQSNTGPGVTSGFDIVGHAPVDSLEEFHAGVAGNEADAGPSSGGQFQLVTKSGTNQFHGDLNEYHRDPSLVANSWFSNNANPIVPRNHLIQNQFGGSIGGPIKRDKLFFFFDFNDSRIISSTLVQRTVPLDSYRNGNLGYINSAGTISYLSPAGVQGLDPAGIGEDTTWLSGINARFPHSNNLITGDGVNSGGYNFNAPNDDYETNYVGRIDYNINDSMKLFGRFTISRENSVQNPNEFGGDPITDPFVDRTYAAVIGHTWVLGANMTNRFIVGETVQKYSFPNDYNPDGSTFFTFSDGTGPALASSLYLNPNAQARRIPIPVVGDDFTWIKGRHIWQFGGTFKDILAHNTNIADYNTTEIGMGGNILSLCGPTPGDCSTANPTESLRPSDLNQGAQIQTAVYDYDQAFAFILGREADVSADYNYTAQGTPLKQLTGDQRFYRYYQTQLYAQDTWKILPNLNISYGVAYQLFSVPYETRGLESVEPFSLNQYMKARVGQSNASQSGPTAVPIINYVLGGAGNGGSAPPLYQPQHALFAPHVGFNWNPGFDRKTVFNGGVSLVYDRTIINAIQEIQDADSYLFQQTEPLPYGISGDPYDSIKTAARLASSNGSLTVSFSPPATPKPPYAPFTGSACPPAGVLVYQSPCGLQLGLAFNATIDPTLKTPYSIAYNFGVQHEMPWNMVLKANYVGRLGRRLLAQGDANQVLDYPDPTSGQTLSAAMGSITQQMRAGATSQTIQPQPFFEDLIGPGATAFIIANIGPSLIYRGDFGDTVQFLSDIGLGQNIGSAAQFSENTFYSNQGFSAYHGLLLTLQKNTSHGLQYDFNYTFSHSIDNVSFFANSEGDTGIGGIGLVCDQIRPRECRGNSDFDLRQNLNADAIYALPFGRKGAFFSAVPTWANELIGGWSVSGIGNWHTGNPWSTNSNAFVASYSNDAPGILIGNKSAVAAHLTKFATGGVNNFGDQNPAANIFNASSAFEGPIGFKIGSRNNLLGPGYFNTDLGLGKLFPIHGEATNLQFRADAFNALNHPNFQIPAENVFNGLDQQDFTNQTFGEISYTQPAVGNNNNGARIVQVSLRLQF
jgi:hypothetical protein